MIRRSTLTTLVSSALLIVSARCIAGKEVKADFGGLDGTWKFEYSCAGSTGPYADRCAAGERDDFMISIAHSGQKVCGWYITTAQLGNHVDEGDLTNWTFVTIGQETYHVHFSLTGTSGEAIARVQGMRLTWRVIRVIKEPPVDEPTWRSFSPPNSATLIRQNADQVRHPAACKS
jgi:hypothetical protein